MFSAAWRPAEKIAVDKKIETGMNRLRHAAGWRANGGTALDG